MKKFSKHFSEQVSLESNKERKALEKRVQDFVREVVATGLNIKKSLPFFF